MLDFADRRIQPELFTREALARLPLAETVLSVWSHVLHPDRLTAIFDQHRGRSFEDALSFPTFVELIADALVQHRGSGRQSLLRAQERDALPTTPPRRLRQVGPRAEIAEPGFSGGDDRRHGGALARGD